MATEPHVLDVLVMEPPPHSEHIIGGGQRSGVVNGRNGDEAQFVWMVPWHQTDDGREVKKRSMGGTVGRLHGGTASRVGFKTVISNNHLDWVVWG